MEENVVSKRKYKLKRIDPADGGEETDDEIEEEKVIEKSEEDKVVDVDEQPVGQKRKRSAEKKTVSHKSNVPLNPKMIQVSIEQVEKLVDEDAPGFESPEQAHIQACKKVTNWKYTKTHNTNLGDCPICLCELDEKVVTLSKCIGHSFHETCIAHCYNSQGYLKCPCCNYIYGVRMGIMPVGTMHVATNKTALPGCKGGTITITYNFASGVQGDEHPSPGTHYTGTNRVCYLPDNPEGQEVLRLLKIAWERRLVFTVGTSMTTGQANCVIWNGIHHKTATSGGPTAHGFPDDTYLARVKSELKDVGVE